MGLPSTSEDIQERRNDSAFCGKSSDPELKALLVAPTAKKKGRPKSKGALRYLREVDRLKAALSRQSDQIARLEGQLEELARQLAVERAHVAQLKSRQGDKLAVLVDAEVRRLKSDLEAKEIQLKGKDEALNAKRQELRDLRKMSSLFGRDG